MREDVFDWVSPLGGGDLEHRLKAVGFQQAGPYVLPATRNDDLPVLVGCWNFDELDDPEVRLRVALFRLAPAGHEHSVIASGVRYESPEPSQPEHGYWHSQPIRVLRAASGRTLPGLPGWLPDDEPTIPINARSADDLIACLLVAVYGFADVHRRQRVDLGNDLAPSLSRLAP